MVQIKSTAFELGKILNYAFSFAPENYTKCIQLNLLGSINDIIDMSLRLLSIHWNAAHENSMQLQTTAMLVYADMQLPIFFHRRFSNWHLVLLSSKQLQIKFFI